MWIGEGYVHKFQCEDGSMSADRPASDAASRDALGRWSTATLHAAEPVGILGVAAEPPAGRIEMVDGRGVYVRCTADSPAGNRNRPAGGNGEPIDDSADRNSDGDANLAGSIDGPDAWYIHGLAGSSTNWTSLAEALSGHATGYSVDLPGHGRSDPPPRGRYSIRDNADLVAALIRRRSPSAAGGVPDRDLSGGAGPAAHEGSRRGSDPRTVARARHRWDRREETQRSESDGKSQRDGANLLWQTRTHLGFGL